MTACSGRPTYSRVDQEGQAGSTDPALLLDTWLLELDTATMVRQTFSLRGVE